MLGYNIQGVSEMLGQTSKVLYTKAKENVHINIRPEVSGFFYCN